MRKRCKDCGSEYPETREFFGQYKNKRAGEVTIGFRNSCRECMRKRSAAHSKANPNQAKERMARRLDRQGGTLKPCSDQDISFIRKQLTDSCRYCGEGLKGRGEIDHLTPVARGGTNERSNLTLACQPCNRAKLSKTLEEFIEWREERGLAVAKLKPRYEKPDIPTTDTQRRTYR